MRREARIGGQVARGVLWCIVEVEMVLGLWPQLGGKSIECLHFLLVENRVPPALETRENITMVETALLVKDFGYGVGEAGKSEHVGQLLRLEAVKYFYF